MIPNAQHHQANLDHTIAHLALLATSSILLTPTPSSQQDGLDDGGAFAAASLSTTSTSTSARLLPHAKTFRLYARRLLKRHRSGGGVDMSAPHAHAHAQALASSSSSSTTSLTCLIVALLYIERLKTRIECFSGANEGFAFRVFFVAVMVASKVLEDGDVVDADADVVGDVGCRGGRFVRGVGGAGRTKGAQRWGALGGVEVKALGAMEMEFLFALDFHLGVRAGEIRRWLTRMMDLVARCSHDDDCDDDGNQGDVVAAASGMGVGMSAGTARDCLELLRAELLAIDGVV